MSWKSCKVSNFDLLCLHVHVLESKTGKIAHVQLMNQAWLIFCLILCVSTTINRLVWEGSTILVFKAFRCRKIFAKFPRPLCGLEVPVDSSPVLNIWSVLRRVYNDNYDMQTLNQKLIVWLIPKKFRCDSSDFTLARASSATIGIRILVNMLSVLTARQPTWWRPLLLSV